MHWPNAGEFHNSVPALLSPCLGLVTDFKDYSSRIRRFWHCCHGFESHRRLVTWMAAPWLLLSEDHYLMYL